MNNITKTVKIGNETYNLEVNTKYRTRKGTKVRCIWGKCDKWPECEWFPENTDGLMTASFSCDGWETEEPNFWKIDEIITSMIRFIRGWCEESEIEETIKKVIEEKEVSNVI